MLSPFVLWLMMPHGALASLRGRRQAASLWDEKDGEVTILRASSPLISGRIERPYELTPSVVPVRTFFCRSRTRYLLAVLRGRFRQPKERRRSPCASGTRYHRPTSGAAPRPGAWRPRRWLDASRAAEPPVRPTPSATTIYCRG